MTNTFQSTGFPPGRLLHEGKFSLVYKAIADERVVIVKQLHPRLTNDEQQVRRFVRESQWSVSKEFGVNYSDYFCKDGHHFLVREFIDGKTLKQILQERSFRSPVYREWKIRLQVNLVRQLTHLHRSGICCGDVKPANFIVPAEQLDPANDPVPLLLDFGLAFRKQEGCPLPLQYSMYYGAPEAVLNFPDLVDDRSDVFSTAILLYEIGTGRLPYPSVHPAMILPVMISYSIPSHPGVSAFALEILREATYRKKFTRPPSQFYRDELKELIKESKQHRGTMNDLLANVGSAAFFEKPRTGLAAWLFGK